MIYIFGKKNFSAHSKNVFAHKSYFRAQTPKLPEYFPNRTAIVAHFVSLVWRSDWGSIPEIQVFVHEKMFCARKHFFYAHKSFAPQILISHMPEDNYMNAKIFI